MEPVAASAASNDGGDEPPAAAAATTVLVKPVIRGKGKALNNIAALSGRDPAAIVKSVTEAEASMKKDVAIIAVDDDGELARASKDKLSSSATTTASRTFDLLSPQEQHRFRCFRRCGFASKPMEEYIARKLVTEVERRRTLRMGATISGLATTAGSKSGGEEWDKTNNGNAVAVDASDTTDGSKKRKRKSTKQILNDQMKRRLVVLDRPLMGKEDEDGRQRSKQQQHQQQQQKQRVIPSLSNLVVANSSQEIVTIVSTLAKCYGQGLVAAAKRVANVATTTTTTATTEDDNAATAGNDPTPLRPHHFIEAYEHRVRAGLDPGFWMMGSNTTTTIGGGRGRSTCHSVTEAAALGKKNNVNNDNLYYHAALAAQNIYDGGRKE